MKKLIPMLLLLVAALHPAMASAKQKVVTVENEVQFVAALGSNTTIKIPGDVRLNLSRVLAGIKQLDYYRALERGTNGIMAGDTFDGLELIIAGVQNLTIEGQGTMPVLIEVEPRYANVLRFLRCSNIRLKNLKVGHTTDNPGYCSGGVLDFRDCTKIAVEQCALYGCGIEGITAQNCQDIAVRQTSIHDCTYGIMTLNNTQNVTFNDCIFHNNKEFSLVNIDDLGQNIKFDNCTFTDNQGTLFYVESRIRLNNCTIRHSGDTVGDTRNVVHTGCDWQLR